MPDHIKGNKFSLDSKIPDFSTYKDVNDKKNDFFAFLLPKIKYANDNILKERRQVFDLKVALPNLSKDEVSTLNALKDKYEVSLTNHEDAINALLKRVDIIPASLALAQAANESAWGTSRFAQEGNNLFGQWCYVKGCGIIPKQRHGKQRHEVAKFDGIVDSIESYMRNLNSQAAYEKLRTLRAEAREDEDVITGVNLANGLWSYSIRREAYVHEIQLMIKQNGLQQYNRPVSHTN
ncbi:MAG: Bax protein [Bermanella sp.]|jgi:Bax protein